MKRSQAIVCAAVVVGTVLLYLAPLGLRGLVGPDEPRYAAVAREMALSGDWITPVLWAAPWFEKPVLLYWLGAGAHSLGLEDFIRVPVALVSLGFLAFFYTRIRRHFQEEEARAATLILATSAGWVAFSDIGGFDLPLSALTTAALLCLLPWIDDESRKQPALPAFGALLGAAVLAKGLVGPAIASFALLPVLWERPRRALDLFHPRTLIPFAVVALPWYVACYARNGDAFLDEFIWKHHVERFISPSLDHVQPFWFYLPVLILLLLPWAPLLACLRPRELTRDRRMLFLGGWVVGSLLFFSLSINKLPGYILPIVPPLAILLGVGWVRRPSRAAGYLAALVLLLVPLAGLLLPTALADGIGKAWQALEFEQLLVTGALSAAVVALALTAVSRSTGVTSLAAIALASLTLLTVLKYQTYPAISRVAGVREFVAEHSDEIDNLCFEDIRRHAEYGLRFYSENHIASCGDASGKGQISGDPPRIVPRP